MLSRFVVTLSDKDYLKLPYCFQNWGPLAFFQSFYKMFFTYSGEDQAPAAVREEKDGSVCLTQS